MVAVAAPDLDVPFTGADALQALADLRAPDLDQRLKDALSGPPSGTISAALDVIGRRDDPRWCGRLYELFCRVDRAAQAPPAAHLDDHAQVPAPPRPPQGGDDRYANSGRPDGDR